jgi:MFS transporter, putative metabolite:H+ symporter
LPAPSASASTSAAHDPEQLIARLESVPFSRWHRKARIIIGSATFFDAFDALSIAFALPVLAGLWDLSRPQIGLLISASYLGQLIGALLFGSLAEKFGRIPSATAAIALMSMMGLACATAGTYEVLLAFRFVQGIGIGGEMPVAAAYINEMSRAQGRGRFFLLYEMIFPIGLMATGQVGAFVVPALGWKAMFLAGAVPGLIIAVLVWRLAESPRWLIAKNRLADADAVIVRIEASARHVAHPPTATAASIAMTPRPTRWAELLAPAFRHRTAAVWTLWACAYFVANGLNNWMPTLYNTIYGLDLQSSLRAASMTNVAQVVLLLACAFVIDRVGRRHWVTGAFLLGGAALGVLGLMGSASLVGVLILGTLSYGIIGSINAVLYLYTPEIYPTRMRAIGTAAATSWLRLASAVAPLMVGYLVAAHGIGSVFLMFAGVSLVGLLAASQMLETRNRRLEDIAQ